MKYKFSIKDIHEAAEEKKGVPGWTAFKWELVGEADSLVTGCVPDGVYRSGPRKGRPRFTGVRSRLIITNQEMVVKAEAFEEATGHCWNCKGSGKTAYRWDKEGTHYKDCSKCLGSGLA